MKQILSLIIAAVWIAADYFSKLWALDSLAQHSIKVNDYMNFHLAFNKGAAFSFLANQGGWQQWFFIGLAVLVSLWLLYVLMVENLDSLSRFGYASILGGALANAHDRLVYGHVVDFIQWHYQDYYWPIFNIADVAITIGVATIIISGIRTWLSSTRALS